jgi:hypothetical protein
MDQSSIIQRDTGHGSEEPRETGAGGLTLIEYLLLGLQPVFEGMPVISAMLLIQDVGPLGDARMEVLGMFIRLVGTSVLIAP